MASEPIKLITENKKAHFHYTIIDEYEAGLVLLGTEVKSLRTGRAHLTDAYARLSNGEFFLYQMYIGPYPFALDNHDPERPRKLLLHRYEIKRLIGKVKEKGFSLIPLKVYFKKGKVKVTIALAKGKPAHDKRETIKRRDEKRDFDREKKENSR